MFILLVHGDIISNIASFAYYTLHINLLYIFVLKFVDVNKFLGKGTHKIHKHWFPTKNDNSKI